MKTLYEQLLPKIVKEFSIESDENIEIQRSMKTGLSGAEVYEVELKSPSKYQGKFFLKIDPKDEEFCNHNVAKSFSHAVTYIEAKEIDLYYVLLIALAGSSGIEFRTFWDSPPRVCKKLISRVVGEVLQESIDRNAFAPKQMPLSKICGQMLGDKITADGTIETFLRSRLTEAMKCSIHFRDKLYPNPLHFAREPVALRDCYYLKARIHSDFHGENIFLSQNSKEYAIIDWALARDDGILFFDSAYFELSVLMQVFDGTPLHEWIDLIECICRNDWEDLDFEKADVIRELHQREDVWITTTTSAEFSHRDKMRLGQYIARVVAGLNFAGKKRISDVKREYAFIFSCVFLKKLFQEAGYQDWAKLPPIYWNQPTLGEDNTKELAEYCSYFSEEYQYILICGSRLPQQELVNERLSRIPWRGVLSLSVQDKEPLKNKIGESKFLRHLIFTQKDAEQNNTILSSDVWWAFVNGYSSSPDSLTSGYPEWRNRYRRHVQRSISKICAAAPPQEMMLIVSYDSLEGQDEKKKVQELLECFDADGNEDTSVVMLGTEQSAQINPNDFANLKLVFFDIDLTSLANFAGSYLYTNRKNAIWLPQQGKKSGVQLDEDDERYIGAFLEIIGDHLLNPSIKAQDAEAFHWGEPITWDAIDRQLPIARGKADDLREEITRRIDQERWGVIELSHVPGAGMSVLVKDVCWRMRREYPVVRVKRICDGTFESLKRISKLANLPILILLDGDYGRNDVEAIETGLGSDLINRKYILVYTYRLYYAQEPAELGILDLREAESFERKYADIMTRCKDYPADEIGQRKQELQQLTQSQALTEFRLPFFYGMYTFHEDFSSVSKYIDKIIQRMQEDPTYCRAVSYLAIISYFTVSYGLSHKIAKKLFSLQRASLRDVRNLLNDGAPSFVYVANAEYRICHPVIAYKILQRIYGNQSGSDEFATSKFSDLCKSFIEDIRRLDGGETASDYADQLVTSIFIKRNQIDRADNTQDSSRNTFSMIVLLLKNPHLQEEVLQHLVTCFPQNPHCFQHYGRLLSSHRPDVMDDAKQQFDQAIHLDEHNPIHYHARGIMYMRYCRQLFKQGVLTTPEMIYDQCKAPVESAIQDFKTAIEQAQKYPSREGGQFNLAYPYSSILDICIMIVTSMKRSYERRYPDVSFWDSGSEVVRWGRGLLTMARQYDMDAAQERPDIGRNTHYKNSKAELTGIDFSQADLKTLIEKYPEDPSYKILYLSNMDTRWENLSNAKGKHLDDSARYCEAVIQSVGADGGLLWKWFQIYIHAPSFNESHALGFLESSQILDSSVTANYLLQILYFCRFFRTRDSLAADMALKYQRKCRELSDGVISGVQRRACPLFLSGAKALPLTNTREKGLKLDCTLTEDVVKEQSAHMTLNLDPRFQVVFIPHHNKNLKIGQGTGTEVEATIGFSYNGLYGFDLQLKQPGGN